LALNVHLLYGILAERKIVDFINERFGERTNVFYLIGEKGRKNVMQSQPPRNYVYVDSEAKWKMLIKDLNLAERIHVYALTLNSLKLLHENRHILPKVNWMIWGADLYYHQVEPLETLRKQLIPEFSMVSTNSQVEYDMAVKKYGARGERRRIIIGPTPMGLEFVETEVRTSKNDSFRIQVGHSARPSSKSIEILNSLMKFKDENVQIYGVISSGSEDYAKKVREHGLKLFGEKFIPVTDPMPPSDYAKFLSGMDAAIFNFDHMHGLGNIYGLLDFGCKVFVPANSIAYDFLKDELGLAVHNATEIANLSFQEFSQVSENERRMNHEIIRSNVHSAHKMEELWSAILCLEAPADGLSDSIRRLTESYCELKKDYRYLVGLKEQNWLSTPIDYHDFGSAGKTKSIETGHGCVIVTVDQPDAPNYIQLYDGGFREPAKAKDKCTMPRIAHEIVIEATVELVQGEGTPVTEVIFMQYDESDRVSSTSVSRKMDGAPHRFEVHTYKSLKASYFKIAIRLIGFKGVVKISDIAVKYYLD